MTASWPPNAKKETGQDPRQRTHHSLDNSEGHGAGSGRVRREGCEEGHSSQRTHKVAFLHRMTQGRRVFAWSGSIALAKSSSQKGGVCACSVVELEKAPRRDDCQASSWPSWIAKPTDKRTRQSEFSTRGLGSAHVHLVVINHLSSLPVACGHAALLFRTTHFGGAPSDAKCGRQPLSNGESSVWSGATGSVRGGAQTIFLPACAKVRYTPRVYLT